MMLLKLWVSLALAGSSLAQRPAEDERRQGDGPERQLLYLSPLLDNPFSQQQRFDDPLDNQNVLLLQNGPGGGRQGRFPGPSYLTQNGIYYVSPDLRDDIAPSQPGYIESIYNWFLGRPQNQPPPSTMSPPNVNASPTPPAPSEVTQNPSEPQLPSGVEDTSSFTDEPRGDAPFKFGRPQSGKIEQLEPDAELIPQSDPQSPRQPRPQVPVAAAPGGNPFIPGQRFFILNPQPQFYSSNPLVYPQIPSGYRPQTQLQVNPSYQRVYLYNGQQVNDVQKQPPQSQGNTVYYGAPPAVPLNVQRLAIPSRPPSQENNANGIPATDFGNGFQLPLYQNPIPSLAYTQTPGAALPLFGVGRQINLNGVEGSLPQRLRYGTPGNAFPQFLVVPKQQDVGFNGRNFNGQEINRAGQEGNFIIRADSSEVNENEQKPGATTTEITKNDADSETDFSVTPVEDSESSKPASNSPPKIKESSKPSS